MLAILAGVCVLGCSPDDATKKRTSEFVGRWEGRYSSGNEWTYRYLIERKADGSYQLQTFRVVGDRLLASETESGRWFVQEGSYKAKAEEIDGRPASAMNTATYQVFSVREVRPDSIRLTHSLSGIQFVERRVALDDKFP